MAHYFESGFFVRDRAWHGLGTVLQNAPSTEEALREAGLDWRVRTEPVFAETPTGNIRCDDARAVVRERNGSTDVLGVVGARYEPVQNVDAFRWFDPLCHEGDVSLEAAGSLKGGRHVWILAKIRGTVAKVGTHADDVVTPYLLLSNAHDGTRAITAAFTPIRVVCWNTLSAAHRAADGSETTSRRIRHTRSVHATLATVRDQLDLERRAFSNKAALWAALGSFPVRTSATVRDYARRVFGKPDQDGLYTEHTRAEEPIFDLFERGPGADSAGRTAFGLYMAATHYIDHERGRNADTRLSASWFGTGAGDRDRAEQVAMAIAGLV